jgi:hypothetical protein
MLKHLIIYSKIDDSTNSKITYFEGSELKIQLIKIITQFTVVIMEIIRITPAIALSWDMVETLATRVQHCTCLLA